MGEKMKLNEVINKYRSPAIFMRETGISVRAWYRWINKGYVPIKAQFKLQKLTDGELVADINDLPEDKRG